MHMKRRTSAWIIPALALGVIGMSLYGYQEHRIESASLATLDLNYQSAFHSMVYDIDELQDALAKALIPKSPSSIITQLHLAAKDAATAQSYVGRLPETLARSSRLSQFLNVMMQKTEDLANQHANGTPFSTSDRKEISMLYNQATQVERATRNVQSQLIQHPTPITHVTSTFAEPVFNVTKQVQDRFSQIGKSVPIFNIQETNTLSHEQSNSHMHVSNSLLSGPVISKTEAQMRAHSILGMNTHAKSTIETLGSGYGTSGYLITMRQTSRSVPSYVAIAQHGGAILWMARDNQIVGGKSRLTVQQGATQAKQFLQSQHFTNVVLQNYASYDGIGNYTFVPVISDVRLLTEPILARVDLTTKVVTHYDATKALLAAPVHISLQHIITKQQANRALQPGFYISGEYLALVENTSHQLILAYNIEGHNAQNVFHILVNAHTEHVVQIDKVTRYESPTS